MEERGLIRALLDVHGSTYAEDLGIDLRNEPEPLFQLLCASLLYSTRILSEIATNAIRAVFGQGWTTPEAVAAAPWRELVRVLDEAKYVRYDEGTATELHQAAQKVIEEYDGDLTSLRDRANRRPLAERSLIEEFRGIGKVGSGIFMREVQVVWDEVFPFLDEKAAGPARNFGLPDNAEDLRKLVGDIYFPRLAAALVKAGLHNDYDKIRTLAAAKAA